MNVWAVTPTGARPQGLALLGQYISAQTYTGPLTWVIVDDCEPASPIPEVRDGIRVKVLRPSWRWKPGQNTQAKAMLAGVAGVPSGATLFILEDDDIYMPRYMETMLATRADLVGEKDSRYYNVASGRWRVLPSRKHASMAATVCRGDALHALKVLLSSGQKRMLDVMLWKTFAGSKAFLPAANVIGIKGLPGRPGIGVGHRRNFGVTDNGTKLREWAGNYADNYAAYRVAA
jgi:hypothetical protein